MRQVFNFFAAGLLMSNASIEPPLTLKTKLGDIFEEWKSVQDETASKEATVQDAYSHRTGLPGKPYHTLRSLEVRS